MHLDDLAGIRQLDTQDMLGLTAGTGRQFREGLALAEAFNPPRMDRINQVLVLGTGGGSAASANLLRSYLFDKGRAPVIVNQGYNLPAWVGPGTLVLTVTHSGNTEEILSAYEQAVTTGCTIICITAGGKLGEMAARDGVPVLRIPGGLMPRAALGYIFVPMLVILQRMGVVPDVRAELDEAITLLEQLGQEYGPETPTDRNLAKQLAEQIRGHIPLVYGTLDHLDSVAWRWKNQFGENSKYMAFWNAVPALHHDEAVGWEMDRRLLQNLAVVLLRDKGDSAKMVKRMDVTRSILQERMGRVIEVHSRGEGLLARMFSLVLLGDFVSVYLPLLDGVDPTPVRIIDHFKRLMAQ
ncbi:MAG TPA: bifunctional phosphoglucose/phosphomannose isomerase [Symbiobacteriaceae bacterium]